MKKLLNFLKDRLFHLSLISFVFVSSCALVLVKPEAFSIPVQTQEQTSLSPLPVLIKTDFFPVVSAQGVIAVDLDSAVVLYEKNPDLVLLPASTTKIMTALVAMDYYSPDRVLEVGKISVAGQKMGLVEGEKIKVEDLIAGLLIYSANDAAEVLAEEFPGGRELFVSKMNLKCQEYSLEDTFFTNPTGLDGNSHHSTARDMARLAAVAMENSQFAEIVRTKTKVVKSIDGKVVHYLTNINELLGEVEGVLGVKTGWTENARENLVTYVKRGDKKVLIALLGSQDRFGETKELINWIFENYTWEEVEGFDQSTISSYSP